MWTSINLKSIYIICSFCAWIFLNLGWSTSGCSIFKNNTCYHLAMQSKNLGTVYIKTIALKDKCIFNGKKLLNIYFSIYDKMMMLVLILIIMLQKTLSKPVRGEVQNFLSQKLLRKMNISNQNSEKTYLTWLLMKRTSSLEFVKYLVVNLFIGKA